LIVGHAIKSSRAATSAKTDAIALLTADHAALTAMFDEFETLAKALPAAPSGRRALANKICHSLIAHTAIEEEIFYPAVRIALDESLLLDRAEVEHAIATTLIDDILAMEPSDDKYDAKVLVLGEHINRHVKEENNEMFPKARKAKLDLPALGEMMAKRRKEILHGKSAPTIESVEEVTVTSYVPRGAGA